MTKVNWRELLGWTDEQLEELRLSGFSFLREGLYQKALIFFHGLVTLDPNNAYDLQTLGAIYLQVGEEAKALTFLNRALEQDTSHEPTLLNKSKALLALNQQTKALELIVKLEKSEDATIANDAGALLIAYK